MLCTGLQAAAGLAASFGLPAALAARDRERLRVTVALDNRAYLSQLPLLLADQLGMFRLEQLEVDFVELGSDARVVQAVQAWSGQASAAGSGAEVGSAGYADLLGRQPAAAAGGPSAMDLQAFAALTTAPLLAMGVSARAGAAGVRSLVDLKGRSVAVPQGAATANAAVRLSLERVGLAASDVKWVGLPEPAAVSNALRTGQIHAVCVSDPKASSLEQSGDLRVLADLRSRQGSEMVFGGLLPASVLFATEEWLRRNAAAAQALTYGTVRALKWMQTAGLGDIMKAVPETYLAGDRALYLSAFGKVRNSFSADGLMPSDVTRTGPRALRAVDANARLDRLSLVRSYTNQFARLAKARFDA